MGCTTSSVAADIYDHEGALRKNTAPMQSVPYPDDCKDPDMGVPRRNAKFDAQYKKLMTPALVGRAPTTWANFEQQSVKFANRPMLGTRVFALNEDGKTYKRQGGDPVRGSYKWGTYKDMFEETLLVSAGLVQLGFKPEEKVALFSANRAELVLATMALHSQSMTPVPLYATLGPHAVEFIIDHAETSLVFCSKDNLPHLLSLLGTVKSMRTIVQFDVDQRIGNVEEVVSAEDVAQCVQHGVRLIGFSELKSMGAAASQAGPVHTVPPQPNDLAVIMYTSGTTGAPKGVMIRHLSLMSTVLTLGFSAEVCNEEDVYVSYLPMAHILEIGVQNAVFGVGGSVAFFQGNIRKLTDDWVAVRPTILAGVPRVFARIQQRVTSQVAEKNCLVRAIFNRAYHTQLSAMKAGKPRDAGYDNKIFIPIRQKVGLDRLKVICSGAAPLPAYMADFLRVVLCPVVQQGYGMTESACSATAALRDDPCLNCHVGPPHVNVEIRLRSVPEMGYRHTDSPPTGEVLIRGDAVMLGYYKNEEASREVLLPGGWLATGDVGRWNPNGSLSIIDRKKNIFKLAQGEYVAAEKLETLYGKCAAVGQIWVYGNGYKAFLVAVVVPNGEWVFKTALAKGWWPRPAADTQIATQQFAADFNAVMTAHLAEWRDIIFAEMHRVEGGFEEFEKVKDILLEPIIDNMMQGFSEANDLLTPTAKMKRNNLRAKYVEQLKQVYTKNGAAPLPAEKW